MNNPGFIWGGNTGLSYAELQQRRRQLEANRGRYSAPRNAGEGLTALGIALSHRLEQGRLNRAQQVGQERAGSAMSAFQHILGGGGAASAPISSSGDFSDFNSSLAHTESGGQYDIRNSEGFTGKYQFGQERLDDFNRANGTKYSTDDLLKSPELQETVQNWHVGDIDRFISANNLSSFVGQEIGGVKLTQNSLRAMAHLGGLGGMQKFLQSGGRYNPSDSNGTSLLDYARTHAGAGAGQRPVQVASADPQQAFQAAARSGDRPQPQPQTQAQAAPPRAQIAQAGRSQAPQLDPRVFELMADPNLSPGQQAVMRLMYQDFMQRNAPVDPLKQLQIQKMQKELNAPPERKIIEGADGFNYFQDTGERVLPNVVAPTEQYRQISGDEAAAMGLDPTKGYNIGPDGKVSQIGGNGTNVTVNTESDFKVPNGYMRDPNNPTQVVAIPGGPAQKLGSETAGRIGLAEDALGQLDEVERFAQQGDMTGLGNYVMGTVLGRGEQGQKVRELKAASEAITRMLTGAGMNEAEAQREVDLYLPKITDGAEDVVNKVNQLKRRLQSIIDVTGRGREGPGQAEPSQDDPLGLFN